MEVIKFNLGGRFAFFKKPEVNSYLYFTYGNIHRVALLGIFGAVLGYKGYNQMDFLKRYNKDFKEIGEKGEYQYPEFYSKLKHLKIAITPMEVNINKKVQVFNNSVGYASKEQGGNLIVKEQWLENPSWDIYVAIEDEEGKKLAKALLGRNFVYIPYLGKNDHLADITKVNLIKDIGEANEFSNINSLFLKDDFQFIEYDEFDTLEDDINIFKYEEKLPMGLEEQTNKYEFKTLIFTNNNLKKVNEVRVYRVQNKNIVFI
ncbi:type I-B CRISPR-associated protein Cas5b [Clostridium sp. A1-XYC3]|uniref:Type I-B CRISPR-associated protein Cas5b n=1 Tax=Clostridium tanneri TaxID=3037988 RepID=A0ABU4JYN1_9CLOT|nr:type I-B CRISPR-associated protein Cas5b [Clostridium sp. A1-XYC3]MDW8803033.1 type I-B CRISPR-associated protein Cas5b [Clostridium sp. A1-XYC3]